MVGSSIMFGFRYLPVDLEELFVEVLEWYQQVGEWTIWRTRVRRGCWEDITGWYDSMKEIITARSLGLHARA